MMIEDYKKKAKQERYFWQAYDVPKDMIQLANNRLNGLLHISMLQTKPLTHLLKSAYLQGVIDGYETAKGMK